MSLPLPRVEQFESFYRREYRRAVALAYTFTGSGVVAEDLAQESLLAAHRHWEKVCRFDNPQAWLRRVLMNRATSFHRTRAAEWRAARRVASRQETVKFDPGLEPEDAEVWEAVRRLPRRQAQVIVLRYVDELSLEEIAETLGCSAGTVKSHLHRGRVRLAQRLEASKEEAR